MKEKKQPYEIEGTLKARGPLLSLSSPATPASSEALG